MAETGKIVDCRLLLHRAEATNGEGIKHLCIILLQTPT